MDPFEIEIMEALGELEEDCRTQSQECGEGVALAAGTVRKLFEERRRRNEQSDFNRPVNA